MSLRNACFISYRHGQFELMKEFVMEFYSALCAELEPMLGANVVYLDQKRLSGGDFYNQALTNDLFESATMIVIYTPTYFHAEQVYCAREYAAMEQLERRRLALLGNPASRDHGLIMPVVLRGAKHLPDAIKRSRQYYDFESFQLGGRRLARHPKFAPAIRAIAAYICDRYQELSTLPDEVFAGADLFRLPDDAEIRGLLSLAAGFRMPFPGRAAPCAPSAVWA
jgi:hypothetical protein